MKYYCGYCGEMFDDEDEVIRHCLEVHQAEAWYLVK